MKLILSLFTSADLYYSPNFLFLIKCILHAFLYIDLIGVRHKPSFVLLNRCQYSKQTKNEKAKLGRKVKRDFEEYFD